MVAWNRSRQPDKKSPAEAGLFFHIAICRPEINVRLSVVAPKTNST